MTTADDADQGKRAERARETAGPVPVLASAGTHRARADPGGGGLAGQRRGAAAIGRGRAYARGPVRDDPVRANGHGCPGKDNVSDPVRIWCPRHGALPELSEAGIGRHEATPDPQVRKRTAEVLHARVVQQHLHERTGNPSHTESAGLACGRVLGASAAPVGFVAPCLDSASLIVT